VKACAEWKEIEDYLRGILAFLGNRGLRDLYVEKCCLSKAAKAEFRSWTKTLVDWRWEFLELSLNPLVPKLDFFFQQFDAKALAFNERGELTVESQCIKVCLKAKGIQDFTIKNKRKSKKKRTSLFSRSASVSSV